VIDGEGVKEIVKLSLSTSKQALIELLASFSVRILHGHLS
jgi:hypothetical protein